MALPKKYDFNDYDNYLTDPNPTTSAEAQDYFRNMDMLVTAMVDTFLWQPGTNYANGDVVKSPSMPNGVEAVCVAENGGKSSNVEPQWGSVGGGNVADGTCFWKLRMQGTVTSVNGAKPNVNGEVTVPTMNGAKPNVNGESGLVPAPSAGDGNKALCGDGTFKDLSGIGGIVSIDKGGTGATNKTDARKNFEIYAKTISEDISDNFNTSIGAPVDSADWLANIRGGDNGAFAGITPYSSGFAFGRYDTFGYVTPAYDIPKVYIGGGAVNKLKWIDEIVLKQKLYAINYNAAISITNDFVATSNGLVRVGVSKSPNKLRVLVNDVEVNYYHSENFGNIDMTFSVHVAKGDVVTWEYNRGTLDAYFFPAK